VIPRAEERVILKTLLDMSEQAVMMEELLKTRKDFWSSAINTEFALELALTLSESLLNLGSSIAKAEKSMLKKVKSKE